jgi:hypothetical protein
VIQCLSGAHTRRQTPSHEAHTPLVLVFFMLTALKRALCRCPMCAAWGHVEGDPCGTCNGDGWVRRRDLPALWERARHHGLWCMIRPPRLPDVSDPRAITFDMTVELHDGTCETPWIVALPNGPNAAEVVTVFCEIPEHGRLYLLLSPRRRALLSERAAHAVADVRAAA